MRTGRGFRSFDVFTKVEDTVPRVTSPLSGLGMDHDKIIKLHLLHICLLVFEFRNSFHCDNYNYVLPPRL